MQIRRIVSFIAAAAILTTHVASQDDEKPLEEVPKPAGEVHEGVVLGSSVGPNINPGIAALQKISQTMMPQQMTPSNPMMPQQMPPPMNPSIPMMPQQLPPPMSPSVPIISQQMPPSVMPIMPQEMPPLMMPNIPIPQQMPPMMQMPYPTSPYNAYGGGPELVSVRGDATYLIPGPICSGSGPFPAGHNCPRAFTPAYGSCVPGIPSFRGIGTCILPIDSVCRPVNGDTWGCVLANDYLIQNPIAQPWGQSLGPIQPSYY